MNLERLTAHDLLIKLVDYMYLWSSKDRWHSLPSVTRRAQILSIQKALGLTDQTGGYAQNLSDQTDYLVRGEFIRKRNAEANKEITDRVTTWLNATSPHLMDLIADGRRVDIQWLFNNLLHYRKDIYIITNSTSALDEGFSAGFSYSQYLQYNLNEIIKSNLSHIDETLCLILDPERRSFTKAEINYPDADLDSIDLYWRMENY